MMTELANAWLLLRPLTEADAPALVEAVQESRDSVGRWMSWATADYGLNEARAWIQVCQAGRSDGSCHEFGIVRRADGRLLGVAGLNQFNGVNRFCNLGYWVRASAQRQGVAPAAVALLQPLAFEALGLARLEIVVAVGNQPSAAVAQRAGARLEGVARNRLWLHGAPADAWMYALLPPVAG
jgi:ribosomal-protein-serine acetyltransferase